MSRSVLVIAGEMSGDQHTAEVIRDVRAAAPDVRFFGIGGGEMRAAGCEIVEPIDRMAVMGLWEVIKRYGFFKQVFARMVALARERRPDLVLLTDYPGFNLRFAAEMKKLGIPVLYYISPQVWAWKKKRKARMAEVINRLMVILPFEVQVFAGTGLRTDFVGHPLVEKTARFLATPPEPLPWPESPRVALLPGSREQEIHRILPLLYDAALRLRQIRPDVRFLVAAASPASEALIRLQPLPAGLEGAVEVLAGRTYEILRQSRAAMVASGTATLDTALLGCPMIIAYRTSALTYAVARRVVTIPHIGLVNIVSGRTVCREFIQDAADPAAMAAAVDDLLPDGPARADMQRAFADLRATLSPGGHTTAAEILMEMVKSK